LNPLHAEWQEEKDGSTSLILKPNCFLSCKLGLIPDRGVSRINDFTVIMDIYFDSFPESTTLFTSTFPENKNDGIVSVNHEGGVGALGEFGLAGSRIPEKAWTRVVATCGGTWNCRMLCTYVDGHRCATIKKNILNTKDGLRTFI
jgi:hypothetical protein